MLNPVDGVAFSKELHAAPPDDEDTGADAGTDQGDKNMLDVDAAEGENTDDNDSQPRSRGAVKEGEGGEHLMGGESARGGGGGARGDSEKVVSRATDDGNGVDGAGGQAEGEGVGQVLMAAEEGGGGEAVQEVGGGGRRGEEGTDDVAATMSRRRCRGSGSEGGDGHQGSTDS